jgi:hypothetical protein
MRTTKPRYEQRSDPLGIGPQLGFAAATFAGFAAWSGLIVSVPPLWIMPVLATMFLLFAAGFAVIAWRNRGEDPTRVTYADVAGALTLIGLFAASTIDPDQLVRIVVDSQTEN